MSVHSVPPALHRSAASMGVVDSCCGSENQPRLKCSLQRALRHLPLAHPPIHISTWKYHRPTGRQALCFQQAIAPRPDFWSLVLTFYSWHIEAISLDLSVLPVIQPLIQLNLGIFHLYSLKGFSETFLTTTYIFSIPLFSHRMSNEAGTVYVLCLSKICELYF